MTPSPPSVLPWVGAQCVAAVAIVCVLSLAPPAQGVMRLVPFGATPGAGNGLLERGAKIVASGNDGEISAIFGRRDDLFWQALGQGILLVRSNDRLCDGEKRSMEVDI